MDCAYCKGECISAGLQKSGVQKFYCKTCKKYQQAVYQRKAWQVQTNKQIFQLITEGMGIRSIARVLEIAISTVIDKIKRIGKLLNRPWYKAKNQIYEIDELWTYVGKKENEVWVTYSIDRNTKEVIDYRVGPRTKNNLKQVTDSVLEVNPRRICTDGLNTY